MSLSSLLEGTVRLSPLRFLLGTFLIQFELYHYTNKTKTLCHWFVLCLFATTTLLLIPLLCICFINEYVYLLCMVVTHRCCCCTNKRHPQPQGIAYHASPAPAALTIMSYNIQSGCGLDGVLNIDRIQTLVAKHDPDILCMQEVEWHSNLYTTDQNEDIAKTCGLKHTAKIETRPQYWGGGYGNTVASKYPIIDTKTLNYSHWGLRNPRKALGCKLDVSSLYNNNGITNANIYVWMICTHLQNDATFDEQWYQSKALRQWTMQLANNEHAHECRGIFIAGDFNLPGWSTPVQHLTTGGFIDTIVGPTYPSNRPKVQFDHLFVQEQSAFQLVNEQDGFVVHGSTASDHAAIVATLRDRAHCSQSEREGRRKKKK